MFYDHVHLRPRGNFLLAQTVRLQMRNLPAAAVPDQPACAALIALTTLDESRMADSMRALAATRNCWNKSSAALPCIAPSRRIGNRELSEARSPTRMAAAHSFEDVQRTTD
ncbi:MAG: hypothetical protein NTY01_05210 [Verrucomicrobia bacterium]|nr:hypothetical protein [Verrucomicrobiota bacterium]